MAKKPHVRKAAAPAPGRTPRKTRRSASPPKREARVAHLEAEVGRAAAALRDLGEAVAVTDAAGAIVEINAAAEALTGWAAAQARGRPAGEVLRLLHEGTRREVDLPVAGALRGDPAARLEEGASLVARDGAERPVAGTCAPIRGAGGAVAGAVVVLRDQSAERAAEKRLRESEERFRAFFDHAPIGKLMCAPDGRLIRVNRAFCEMVGYAAQELAGTGLAPVTHPDDLAAALEAAQGLLGGAREVWESERRFLARDGRAVWASVSTRLHRDAEGRPLWLLSHVVDLTARRRAEQQLAEQHTLLLNIVESSNDAIFSVDRALRYTSFNARHAGMMRALYGEEIALGRGILDYQKATVDRVQARRNFERALAGERFVDQAYSGEEARSRLSFEVTHNPVRDGAGEIVGVSVFARDITARTRAQDALRESEQKYRHLFESITDAVVSVDMSGRFLEFNRAFQDLTGYPAEELSRLNRSDITPDAWHEMEARLLEEQVLARGYSDIYQKEYVRKDGSRVPVELRTMLIRDGGGRPAAVWAIIRDISRRRRAEEQLESLTLFNRAVLDGLSAHLCVLDARGRILAVNRAWERFAEANPPVARFVGVGADYFDVCRRATGEDALTARQMLRGIEAVAAGELPELSLEYPCHSPQEQRWFSALVTRFHDEEPPARVVIAHSNITARRRAEEAVQRLSERHRIVLSRLTAGIVVVGRDDRIEFVNEALVRQLELPHAPVELLGWHTRQFLAAILPKYLDPARVDQRIRQAVAQGSTQSGEEVALRSGRVLLVDFIPLAVDGVQEGRLWLQHDVSELKNAERALLEEMARRQEVEVELRHSQKLEAVGQLAAGIAHEINTPVQFVGDSIHFLKEASEGTRALLGACRRAVEALRDAPGHEELLREIRRIEDEVDLPFLESNVPPAFDRCFDGLGRVQTIVVAMKEFAHPGERDKSPADLNKALRSTLTISANEYKYVAECEADLGEIPLVVCHLGDLNQVFLNLIVNAAHAIAEGVGGSGARGRIRVSTRRDGPSVCVEISDTGAGIPEAIRERVFEPFFTTKPLGKGSGQGLAIARSIVVDKHGGSLSFQSKVGEGTTFTIRLPIDGGSTARGERTS